jgi:hypothetical protein
MNRLSSPTSGPLVDPTGPSSSRRVDPLVDPREWTDRDSPLGGPTGGPTLGVRPVGFATVDTGGPTRWTDQLTPTGEPTGGPTVDDQFPIGWTHWWTTGETDRIPRRVGPFGGPRWTIPVPTWRPRTHWWTRENWTGNDSRRGGWWTHEWTKPVPREWTLVDTGGGPAFSSPT